MGKNQQFSRKLWLNLTHNCFRPRLMAVHQSCEEVAIGFCRIIYEVVKSVFRLTKSGCVFLRARTAQWTPLHCAVLAKWLNYEYTTHFLSDYCSPHLVLHHACVHFSGSTPTFRDRQDRVVTTRSWLQAKVLQIRHLFFSQKIPLSMYYNLVIYIWVENLMLLTQPKLRSGRVSLRGPGWIVYQRRQESKILPEQYCYHPASFGIISSQKVSGDFDIAHRFQSHSLLIFSPSGTQPGMLSYATLQGGGTQCDNWTYKKIYYCIFKVPLHF